MTTPTTRKLTGQFFDAGGNLFNARHPDFGLADNGPFSAITQALSTAYAAGGGIVLLPPLEGVSKVWDITEALTILPGTFLKGVGPGTSVIEVTHKPTHHAVIFPNNSERCGLADLTIQEADQDPDDRASGEWDAVSVNGNVNALAFRDLEIIGCGRGFARRQETTGYWAKNLTLERVVTWSCATFGFQFDWTDGVDLIGCSAYEAWLDGFKLIRHVQNLRITGGEARFNGQVRLHGGSGAGDGLDGYAGSKGTVFSNFTCSDNGGNGITLKTDAADENGHDTEARLEENGPVEKALISNYTGERNFGSGLGYYSMDWDDVTQTLIAPGELCLNGAQLNDNGNYGLFLNARNVTTHGVVAIANGLDGVRAEPRTDGLEMFGNVLCGNGTSNPGVAYAGLRIEGKRVKVWGGRYIGVDPRLAKNEAEYELRTKNHAYGIFIVEAVADEIEIHHPDIRHSAIGPIGVTSTVLSTARLVIHHRGTLLPNSVSGPAGGIGSTYEKTDASDIGLRFWVRTSGDSSVRDSGWSRLAYFESGNTANRPTTELYPGRHYWDTTLDQPIWYDGSGWVDATGSSV